MVKMGCVVMLVTTKIAFFFFSLLFTWLDFVRKCVLRLKGLCWLEGDQVQRNVNKVEQEKKKKKDNHDDEISESLVWFRFRTYDEYLKRNGELVKDEAADDQPVTCENGSRKKSKNDEFDINNNNNINNNNFKCKKDVPMNGASTDIDSFRSKELVKPRVCSLKSVNSRTETRFRKKKTVRFGDVTVAGMTNSESRDINDGLGGVECKDEHVSESIDYCTNDDNQCIVSDSDSESMVSNSSSSTKSSLKTSLVDSNSDGFLSDIDFQKAFEFDASKDHHTAKQETEFHNVSEEYTVSDWVDDDDDEDDDNDGINNVDVENKHNNNNVDNKLSTNELDEQNEELEKQWEHQDLLEQLKMEIKKVRAIGLPTIIEESELSPKISEDFKAWKISDEIEKFEHERKLDELQKLYKSYKERMRILDILNYQKMYAIGFLQRKKSVESLTKRNISPQTMATIVSLDCWPCKSKCATEIHQPVMKKLNRELESELEKVYVGQMCLSWDFMRLQYKKALDLWDSDPHGVCQYNHVGERFRQFQILLSRFLEDEPYHGPRVQHYVKTRCVVRYLLHVPLIRDDNVKDKRADERQMERSKDGVTIVKLVELIEESIRIFWKFIRVDKDTSISLLLKCRRVSNIELQNPGDANLFALVRSILLKKEKKLKEVLRSENCILRKFQNEEGDNNITDHVLYFFSHVDLRLVQRVLNMSKITTDQLVWCRNKLNNIHFIGKKLLVEPSITLFPTS